MQNRVVSILTIAMICLVSASDVTRANPDQSQAKKPGLRVMTYNVLNGGTRRGQPLSQTAKVIQASGADIVGLQRDLRDLRVRQYLKKSALPIDLYGVYKTFHSP
jgi:endonuclease/exonuclease/phosphatase family metal-dependent hydrolase